MRGAQQGGIGDTGERATTAPIIHQRAPEDVLSDPLDDHPFGLGCLQEVGGLRAKSIKRGIRKADSEPVHTIKR